MGKSRYSTDDFYLNLEKPLIGDSESILTLKKQIDKISKAQAPIFIFGESGVGKEVVARAIHKKSNRSNGPFITINCGAIPAELIESELFGYKKGSFSGALTNSLGLIRSADGGTLFLDEIAELPMALQVKLLQVVQEKKIRPLGGEEIIVDFRIISATHQNLYELIDRGGFRRDLFFRLAVIDLTLPPLRDRLDDIIPLAEHFAYTVCNNWGIPQKAINDDVKAWLLEQPFKGNVRELQNMIERAITLSENDEIVLNDFNGMVSSLADQERLAVTSRPVPRVIEPQLTDKKSFVAGEDRLEDYLAGVEKKILLDVIDQASGNKTTAAKLLGITFRSMRYRLNKLHIAE